MTLLEQTRKALTESTELLRVATEIIRISTHPKTPNHSVFTNQVAENESLLLRLPNPSRFAPQATINASTPAS